jgi:hypothetical protein
MASITKLKNPINGYGDCKTRIDYDLGSIKKSNEIWENYLKTALRKDM